MSEVCSHHPNFRVIHDEIKCPVCQLVEDVKNIFGYPQKEENKDATKMPRKEVPQRSEP